MTAALAHERQGSLGVAWGAEWAGHRSVHAALALDEFRRRGRLWRARRARRLRLVGAFAAVMGAPPVPVVAALPSRRTRLDEGGVVRQASVRLPRQQQLPGDRDGAEGERDGAEGERDRLLRRAASKRSCSPPSDLPEPRIATSRGRDGVSNRL